MCATLKNNPAETTFRQQAPPPAGLKRLNRAARFLRRGNAMIMAVSLTVLLAIIGSSFVLMSRLDRQSTRGVEAAALADAAVEAVIAAIQKQLAADMFQDNGTLKPDLYDYPGSDANHDRWLASIEPVAETDANGVTTYHWPHISDLQGPGQRLQIHASPWPNDYADADGDGIPDSILQPVPGLAGVWYAVRIIDNSGMVNANVSWKRAEASGASAHLNYARVADPDSYGEFLHQIDLYRLPFRRYGIAGNDALTEAKNAHSALLNDQDFKVGATHDFDIHSALYQNLFVRDYGWFGLLPLVDNGSKLLQARPFGIEDELELRNRFTINTTSDTRLETVMMRSIGAWNPDDPTGKSGAGSYRTLPYDPTYDLRLWYAHITGDRSRLTTADDKEVPLSQQRYMLTTYSFGREVRPSLPDSPTPTPQQTQAEAFLDKYWDDASGPGSRLGKFRKVNINRVLELWFNNTVPLGERQRAVLRLAKAFQAAGYYQDTNHPLDMGLQFVANLIDFVDPESKPTVFPLSQFAAFGATRDIFGTEQQPLITEVYNYVDTDDATESAVEIYNPEYNDRIYLAGWELRHGTAWSIELGLDTNDIFIDPGQRIIYRQTSGLTLANTDGKVKVVTNSGLKFSPANNSEPLLLVRKQVPSIWGTVHELVIDYVRKGDMQALFPADAGAPARAYAIWRALRNPDTSMDIAPWGCTRNWFSEVSDTHHLGELDKPLTNVLSRSGMPIRVDNRGPLIDSSLPSVYAPTAGVNPLPSTMWQIHGWHELSRILLVGNPSVADVLAGSAETITDAIKNACESWNDLNGNDFPDAGEWGDEINQGVFDRLFLNERKLRLDFAWPAPRLMDRISLVSRTDDGIDNDNEDDDSMPDYTADPVVDPGMYTGADDLLECRVPGRINVNTASEGVLKALFPALYTYEMQWNTDHYEVVRDNGIPRYVPLNPDELDVISGWYAKAIVYLRSQAPFTSLADLADRLDKFDNPKVDGQGNPDASGTPVLPDLATIIETWVPGAPQAGCLRFGILVDAVKFEMPERPRIGWDLIRSQLVGVTPVGYPMTGSWPMVGDFEERDWIFSRMANLLTVRSDTFTAYILIKAQDIERRYIAILDRSNVFLPEAAARDMLKYQDIDPPNGRYDPGEPWERWDDANNDGIMDPDEFIDGSNGLEPANGILDPDDSGEMAIFDPAGAIYGPDVLNDCNHFDRKYVTPRVVALRQVPDPR